MIGPALLANGEYKGVLEFWHVFENLVASVLEGFHTGHVYLCCIYFPGFDFLNKKHSGDFDSQENVIGPGLKPFSLMAPTSVFPSPLITSSISKKNPLQCQPVQLKDLSIWYLHMLRRDP